MEILAPAKPIGDIKGALDAHAAPAAAIASRDSRKREGSCVIQSKTGWHAA